MSIGGTGKSPDYRNALLAGEPIYFTGEEPEEKRTIDAEWLQRLIQIPGRVMQVPVKITNAIIRGPIALSGVAFENDFCLTGPFLEVRDRTDFSYSVFKRKLVLAGARFADATFEGAMVGHSCDLDGAKFLAAQASFVDFHVQGVLLARGIYFGEKTQADFSRAQFDKSAVFQSLNASTPAKFEGGALFVNVRIGSQAQFQDAEFSSQDVAADFSGASIGAEALFTRARFGGTARFTGIHANSDLMFRGAVFEGRVLFDSATGDRAFFGATWRDPDTKAAVFKDECSFIQFRVGSEASFQEVQFESQKEVNFDAANFGNLARFVKTTFCGPVHFRLAHFGQAAFQGAVFKSWANFNGATLALHALFRAEKREDVPGGGVAPAKFEGKADFGGAVFNSNAEFTGVDFGGTTEDEADTTGGKTSFFAAQFNGPAFFSDACFHGAANFTGAKFEHTAWFDAVFDESDFGHTRFHGDAHFENAVFKHTADFRESSFRALFFSESGASNLGTQFQSLADLRGCTFERIQVKWQSLLRDDSQPSQSRLAVYDRQPYAQLEKVFRSMGRDREADDVYLERCRVEHRVSPSLRESLYRWVANYGIRPYRLAVFAAVFILVGTVIFSSPASVALKNESDQEARAIQMRWSYWNAFSVSLHQFLPIEIPLGSRWQPSDNYLKIPYTGLRVQPSCYATFCLRLTGWILVPLATAVMTGLVRRVTP